MEHSSLNSPCPHPTQQLNCMPFSGRLTTLAFTRCVTAIIVLWWRDSRWWFFQAMGSITNELGFLDRGPRVHLPVLSILVEYTGIMNLKS